ncbi:MAG: transglutaminase-like domain-containing protein [Angelakisella sp.]
MQDIVDQTLNSGGASASSATPEPTPEPTPSLPASTTVGEGNLYIQQLAANTISKLELSGKDPFRQVQSVYEHLIANTTFAPPVGLDSWQLHQSVQPSYLENRALSPLAYGIGSCEDYAAAMVVLLRELGFEARYVPGITISVAGDFVDHAWAAVQIQGNWYHLDPQLEDNIMKNSLLRYRYFLKTDKEMLVDHRWGKNLLEYGGLTKEQQQEVEKNYLLPPCKREYPAVTPAKLASPPPPNIGAITTQIAAERAAYEAAHGKLAPVTLNITPPVFGNAGYGPPD